MNKVDIVRAASAKSGYRQLDVAEMFDAVLEVMHEAVLNKDTIYLQGIGRIATVLAPSRPVYDPRQKCMIHSRARYRTNFEMSAPLVDELKDLYDKEFPGGNAESGTPVSDG